MTRPPLDAQTVRALNEIGRRYGEAIADAGRLLAEVGRRYGEAVQHDVERFARAIRPVATTGGERRAEADALRRLLEHGTEAQAARARQIEQACAEIRRRRR